MARNFRPRIRREPLRRSVKCGCGDEAKLFSRRSYPFGRKSKSLLIIGWKCKTCGEMSILSNGKGGK